MKDFYSFDEFSMPIEIKVLFWGFYMVMFLYVVKKMLFSTPIKKRHLKVSSLIVLYFTVYAVFYCINTDYFRYREWLKISSFTEWQKEQVYVYIIMFCRSLPFDYPFELFRLIVWGGGLLVVLHTAKMYRGLLMPKLVILLLFVFYSGTFSYARASLAMAIYFMGVSIFLYGKTRFEKMAGLGLAVCSYFFHHELIIGVGALPCLVFPFEKKKTIFLSSILLAMMIVVLFYINSHPSFMEKIFGNDTLTEKIEYFNQREQAVFRVSTFISYLNIFFPFGIITYYFFKYKQLPKAIVGIYRITFFILMATITFFVVSGPRSVYTYRVMYIAIIPMAIMITYCYNQGIFKKYQFAIMLLFAFITNSLRLFSSMQ